MLNHFLAVGGNEVINSERSYGYTQSGDCAVDWLEDPEAATLAEAEGDSPYHRDNISDAPWYDPDDPDTSSRFLGAYGIDIMGLSDSTREASIVQKNGDGATVTGYRHGPREVRVTTWLTAEGRDALEVGNTWLRNVLEPNACGVHGGSCGTSDTAFFAGTPPERREVTRYTDWVTVATNRALNPIADTTWAAVYGTGGAGTVATIPGQNAASTRRLTVTTVPTSGSPYLNITSVAGLNIPVVAGEEVPISIDTSSSGPLVQFSYTWVGASGNISSGTSGSYEVSTSPTEPSRIDFRTPAAPAGATSMTLRLQAVRDALLVVNSWFTGARLMIGGSPIGYFDGNNVDDDLTQFAWASAVNGSASTMATRTSYVEPEDDATYLPYIDTYRRFLHSVRCISGPFTVMERESIDGKHVGRLVEFTLLAEVPYVFGLPKEIPITPIVPTVVQDIAYNLVPYPSAELAGPAVQVAVNYFRNPSLETNADNWTRVAGTGVLDANLVASRVVGELSAVGPASYRTVMTATNGGSNGYFGNNQAAPTPIPTAAGTRVSITAWSACVITAGSPVLGNISFFAFWTNASNAIIGNTGLGSVPSSGGAVTVKSIAPPAGTTGVIIEARCNLTSWVAGNAIRLYTDAVAVTVP